ncbi:MAG: hypothetical protein WAS21_23250 [Geminicoccaceae bacterium]
MAEKSEATGKTPGRLGVSWTSVYLLEQNDLGAMARGPSVLGPDRHDTTLPGTEGKRVVTELDHEVTAPHNDDFSAVAVIVPAPFTASCDANHADRNATSFYRFFPFLPACEPLKYRAEIGWSVHGHFPA